MNTKKLIKRIPFLDSALFKNSFWGLAGSIFQNIFLSLFFVIIARKYSTDDFGYFLIANALYQFVAAFSALGLGQWFIREIVGVENKNELIHKFMKMQLAFGLLFFFINIGLSLVLYEEQIIRTLGILLGLNIIFDNLIYGVKFVNIAEFTQKRTSIIFFIEALIKFGIGCLLFIYPLSIILLSVLLISLRFLTLNLFLKVGAGKGINLSGFWKSKIEWPYIKNIVYYNWPFIIIGSAYIIYWRLANIIISKTLSLVDVANYEISYKVFSLAQIIPMIVSSTLFPILVNQHKNKEKKEFINSYKRMYRLYMVFGLMAFTFTYSFADILLPFAFGSNYADTGMYTKQMFATILIFPTGLLQANLLVAMKLEKLDMWFNVGSVVINTAGCLIGLYFIKSLTVVNTSIFISFLLFHLAQDVVLIKKKISSFKELLFSFLIIGSLAGLYIYFSGLLPKYIWFTGFWLVALSIYLKYYYKDFTSIKTINN